MLQSLCITKFKIAVVIYNITAESLEEEILFMRSILTKKLMAVLLAVCMIAALMPVGVFAADSATQTADFTTGECENAINLLNDYKTGQTNSTWDNGSKTLTLNGINFTTTAKTAVKLPAGSTIVLKDGTSNTIQSGGVTLNVSGDYSNQTYINALDAAGSLTIKGETEGTGALSVEAGALKNNGDGWVYSTGISVDGNFTVESGLVTTRGGCVESDGSCFSYGVKMDSDTKNKALMVTGGTLTAIADKAYELVEGGTKRAVFSRGVEVYRGSVIVSGDGKLRAESVKEMAEATVMSNGLYISAGNLTVEQSAEVAVAGARAAYISGGSIQLQGGKFTATSTQEPDYNGNLGYAISVNGDKTVANSGNITVNDGILETVNGQIYMYTIDAMKNQGMFTVTGGTIVNSGQLYGAKKVDISGGTMKTQGIDTDALTLSGGTLTIREAVRKNPYYNNLLVRPALDVNTLTVSGGTLYAAWYWGEFTPIVFPIDDYYGYADPLVEMKDSSSSATFTGGTTTLDTGKAGNTALLIKGQLNIGDDMAETGADTNQCQIKSDIPVKIAAATASTTITIVDVENVKLDYQPGSTPQASAKPAGANKDKYDILFERWEKLEQNEAGTVTYWYSDESYYEKNDLKITEFEKDVQYRYSIKLKAVGDYKFDDNTGLYINGGDLKSDANPVTVSDDGKTICFEGVMTITPKAFSGGGSYVPVQKPEIITGEGGKATLENNGTTLVIAPDDGMQISKVTVNGNEVTVTDNKITGLKTGDKVEVTFDKIPPAKEEIDKAFKEKLLNLGLTVRTSKTTKKNVKAVVKETSELKDLIKEIKDAGYTVKYKFYRSTKKSSKYIATVTKTENTYTNTTGKKGTKYYYKARLAVYDTDGNLVAQTELKQCKYGLRTWSK